MKNIKLLFTLTVALFTLSLSNCQESSGTPEAVKETFQAKYPGENDPDWEIDANGNYESHFKIDGIKYRADFAPNGMWIETETSIKKKELPQVIKDVIARDYPDDEITEVEKVDHHAKGMFYDVEFKRKGKNMDVEFDASGKVLNR